MKKRLIGIIILAALVILGGTFWWLVKSGRISPFAAQVPTISLYPSSSIYNVGTTFGVNIMADSASQQITGVDIHKLHFDPSKLQLEGQVQTGGMFAVYSTPEVDTGAGTIALSGFVAPGTEQIAISGVFASLTFRVLAAGNSQLSFDFTAGNTTDTNITKYDTGTGTVSDILEQATSGNYTLQQPTPAPSPTSGGGDGGRGTATPTPPTPTPPTPTPGEPTPTAEEITGPGIEETPPTGTPAPAEIAQGLTPSPGAVTSPSPQVTKSPASPSPKASPKPSTKLAGFAITPAVGILLYIGIPVLITLIIFYIWWRRRKKTSQPTPEKKEDFDDDEII